LKKKKAPVRFTGRRRDRSDGGRETNRIKSKKSMTQRPKGLRLKRGSLNWDRKRMIRKTRLAQSEGTSSTGKNPWSKKGPLPCTYNRYGEREVSLTGRWALLLEEKIVTGVGDAGAS